MTKLRISAQIFPGKFLFHILNNGNWKKKKNNKGVGKYNTTIIHTATCAVMAPVVKAANQFWRPSKEENNCMLFIMYFIVLRNSLWSANLSKGTINIADAKI